ncbi:hypothetical protein PYCC9005_003520 [Savitreella phatthalungensis]
MHLESYMRNANVTRGALVVRFDSAAINKSLKWTFAVPSSNRDLYDEALTYILAKPKP